MHHGGCGSACGSPQLTSTELSAGLYGGRGTELRPVLLSELCGGHMKPWRCGALGFRHGCPKPSSGVTALTPLCCLPPAFPALLWVLSPVLPPLLTSHTDLFYTTCSYFYSLERQAEEGRGREGELPCLLIRFSKCLSSWDRTGLEPGSRSSIRVSHVVAETQLLELPLLPPRVYTGRKLDSGARARHCDIWNAGISPTRLNACPHFRHS